MDAGEEKRRQELKKSQSYSSSAAVHHRVEAGLWSKVKKQIAFILIFVIGILKWEFI